LLIEDSTQPLFKFNCAKFLLELGEPDAAFEHVVGILQNFPKHEVAAQLLESIMEETSFCSLTQQMSDSSIFTRDMNNLANIFLECGTNYAEQGEFRKAADIYESFLVKFPEHPSVETINHLLPELLVKAARASGSGTIERPNETGWAPEGIARVVIQNDSPHDLRIVFSGPDARIEILPACETCMDYYAVGPTYCPEQGPIGTYDLTPGDFDVLVETTNEEDVIPFTGTWGFQGGKAFYTCFFIVTTTVY
jgi:tetratricopeptide (TPR) repeat protein